jgi:hypothetical protein
MDISYCEKWWIGRNKPINPISVESAGRRHESREPYVALIGGSERPRYIVDVAGGWVSVVFMDRKLRQYLRYDFKEKQPGRLFLKSAYYWEYEGDSDSERSSKIFSFNEDGHIIMEERNIVTGELRELETTASLDDNWERYPSFGEYSFLCKEDRSLKEGA